MVKYKYDAWGNHEAEVAAEGYVALAEINPFRYRGYYYDTETELYFLQTRYYDPEVGRFISRDSIEYATPEIINGLNLYAYCGDNPVMGYDPNGAWDWGNFWKTVAVVAAVVAVVAIVATVTVLTGGSATTVIAGAVIGASISLGSEFVGDLIDDGKINNGIDSYLASFASGAIAGMGAGFISSICASGAGDVIGGLISGEIDSFKDAFKAFAIAAVTTALFYGAGKLVKKGFATHKYKKIVGNSTKSIVINKKLKLAGYGNAKIGKHGKAGVINIISEKGVLKYMDGTISNIFDFIAGIWI